MISKDYVQQLFPAAKALPSGELFEVVGVPGLLAQGVTEEFAWQAAAQYLSDPITGSAVLNAADFTVEEAMSDRFREGMGTRSQEYRHGFESMLRLKLEGIELPKAPYPVGSAQADAYWSGQEHAGTYVRRS